MSECVGFTLSPHKAEKPASPTVTITVKPNYWLANVDKNTVKNNVVSGSSGSGNHTLWELRGDRVKTMHKL